MLPWGNMKYPELGTNEPQYTEEMKTNMSTKLTKFRTVLLKLARLKMRLFE